MDVMKVFETQDVESLVSVQEADNIEKNKDIKTKSMTFNANGKENTAPS